MKVSGAYHFCTGCDHMEYVPPATGDNANLALWIGLMTLSAIGAARFVRKSRKKY